ncbi:glycosyltransferase [uncultured Desulfobacter sp.]|uniref:glycosyltransferase family 32 protein n=1 Tax=uncultured Desulfobacter sp. TaxID=240139 RepID=UPI002AA66378|nr:glycosyltransferase [uncultured Desulfobacter sp.]
MSKIIHQMWLQGKDCCPTRYLSSVKKWIDINPTYQHIFWDEKKISKFLKDHFPEYKNQWLNLNKPIKKCDAARYFILYHFGGVYADLDTTPYQSIDKLIENLNLQEYEIILSKESNDPLSWKSSVSEELVRSRDLDFVLANAILISKTGSQFWLDFVEKAFQRKDEMVLESFSTWHLTRFYKDSMNKANICILNPKYLLNTRYKDENTYVTHRYDALWFDYSLEKPWEV